MSESIIADFVGKFNAEVLTRDEPVNGRVLLSRKRLVLAAGEDDKLTIPVPSIFYVGVGHIPPDLGEFFQSTVTIAFEMGDARHVAAVEADDETVSKFSTVLFKAILNGAETTVMERARVGGRVTNESFTSANLFVRSGGVEFRGSTSSFEVPLNTVTDFKRNSRVIDGSTRRTLTVRHMVDGTAVTTVAALSSSRKLFILGRFLRMEYAKLMTDIECIELTTEKKEILVAMYSTGDLEGMPLANVVNVDSSQVTMLLQELEDDDLLQDSASGPSLSPMGEVVASRYLGDVNE